MKEIFEACLPQELIIKETDFLSFETNRGEKISLNLTGKRKVQDKQIQDGFVKLSEIDLSISVSKKRIVEKYNNYSYALCESHAKSIIEGAPFWTLSREIDEAFKVLPSYKKAEDEIFQAFLALSNAKMGEAKKNLADKHILEETKRKLDAPFVHGHFDLESLLKKVAKSNKFEEARNLLYAIKSYDSLQWNIVYNKKSAKELESKISKYKYILDFLLENPDAEYKKDEWESTRYRDVTKNYRIFDGFHSSTSKELVTVTNSSHYLVSKEKSISVDDKFAGMSLSELKALYKEDMEIISQKKEELAQLENELSNTLFNIKANDFADVALKYFERRYNA